ncbi:hypothetical protein D3C72_1786240 [compost metagenome]
MTFGNLEKRLLNSILAVLYDGLPETTILPVNRVLFFFNFCAIYFTPSQLPALRYHVQKWNKSSSFPQPRGIYADRLATWEAWETVSNAAQGNPMQ